MMYMNEILPLNVKTPIIWRIVLNIYSSGQPHKFKMLDIKERRLSFHQRRFSSHKFEILNIKGDSRFI